MFDTFDEYLEFCTSVALSTVNTYNLLKKTSLYLYDSKYYLSININYRNINTYKSFHYYIIEFAKPVNNSDMFERKLKEYGKIIFKTNAINNCVKHFK